MRLPLDQLREAEMNKRPLFLFVLFTLLLMLAIPGTGEKRKKIELKPALLVIDMQNMWLPKMAEEDKSIAPDNINALIALFRKHNRPIIRVYHTDSRQGPDPKTELFEFPASIAIRDDDVKIIKNHPSSFTNTDLEKILREKECNTLFLCGLSATGCVLATYFGAMDRGFYAVMVEGALLSSKADYTKVIEDICASMTMEEVKETLKNPFL